MCFSYKKICYFHKIQKLIKWEKINTSHSHIYNRQHLWYGNPEKLQILHTHTHLYIIYERGLYTIVHYQRQSTDEKYEFFF